MEGFKGLRYALEAPTNGFETFDTRGQRLDTGVQKLAIWLEGSLYENHEASTSFHRKGLGMSGDEVSVGAWEVRGSNGWGSCNSRPPTQAILAKSAVMDLLGTPSGRSPASPQHQQRAANGQLSCMAASAPRRTAVLGPLVLLASLEHGSHGVLHVATPPTFSLTTLEDLM